jgi:hypothetical protein
MKNHPRKRIVRDMQIERITILDRDNPTVELAYTGVIDGRQVSWEQIIGNSSGANLLKNHSIPERFIKFTQNIQTDLDGSDDDVI